MLDWLRGLFGTLLLYIKSCHEDDLLISLLICNESELGESSYELMSSGIRCSSSGYVRMGFRLKPALDKSKGNF